MIMTKVPPEYQAKVDRFMDRAFAVFLTVVVATSAFVFLKVFYVPEVEYSGLARFAAISFIMGAGMPAALFLWMHMMSRSRL